MRLKSKLPDVGITIFTIMSKLAADTGAVNLSQGFPDFDVAPRLVELVNTHMKAGRNQYAPMQGVEVLRQALASKTEKLYGAAIDPDTQITITSGATEALYSAITALVHPGDEVMVIEPAFDSYVPAILLNQGIPVFSKLTWPEYGIDWDQVLDRVGPKTRAIILNSPHNPTGTVLGSQDIEALRLLVSRNDLFIISDEVYEHIIFDGRPHHSMLRYPELARRSLVISSFGKTYHTTGWKIGYCIAPPELTAEFQKVHQFLTFASNTPIQYAYADILTKPRLYLELGSFYQRKRDLFLELIADSRFTALQCRGTYFIMLDYSKITSEADIDFARRMTRQYGVAAIPPSVFYHDGTDNKVLRFCFAKKDQTLQEAAEKLCKI